MRHISLFLLPAVVLACSSAAQGNESDGLGEGLDAVAARGMEILKKNCFDCHSAENFLKKKAPDLSSRDSFVKSPGKDIEPWVVEKDAANSALFAVIAGENVSMPKKRKPLGVDDVKALRDWVDAGFQFPTEQVSAEKTKRESKPRKIAGDVAVLGMEILKQNCFDCHSAENSRKHRAPNLSYRDAFVKPPAGDILPLVVEKDSAKSTLFDAIAGETATMPKKRKPLSDDDVQVLRDWVDAGFDFSQEKVSSEEVKKDISQWVPLEETLQLIRDDLDQHQFMDRKFQRYFTFANVFNRILLSKNDPTVELRRFQVGLTQVLNSLSWEKNIYHPRKLGSAKGKEGIVMAIDLRELDWTQERWSRLFTQDASKVEDATKDQANKDRPTLYPYYLDYSDNPNGKVSDLASKIKDLSQNGGDDHRIEEIRDPLFVRADWFIANATRPPLYQIALRLPRTVAELEERLGVDVVSNLKSGTGVRVIRAGFNESKVSRHNRVIERHVMMFGAYWKSYDFRSKKGEEELLAKPFGPIMKDNPFAARAFQHAGGEMIFNLPNGLQGYFLSDGEGNRLDSGPTDIVFNSERGVVGSEIIVNGLSCMACHSKGVREDFKNDITRDIFEREEIQYGTHLYPALSVILEKCTEDQQRFTTAMSATASKVLDRRIDKPLNIVGTLAEQFLEQLRIEDIAAEMEQSDLEHLKSQLTVMPAYRKYVTGETPINRPTWELPTKTVTMFQDLSEKLKIGTPRSIGKLLGDQD